MVYNTTTSRRSRLQQRNELCLNGVCYEGIYDYPG